MFSALSAIALVKTEATATAGPQPNNELRLSKICSPASCVQERESKDRGGPTRKAYGVHPLGCLRPVSLPSLHNPSTPFALARQAIFAQFITSPRTPHGPARGHRILASHEVAGSSISSRHVTKRRRKPPNQMGCADC